MRIIPALLLTLILNTFSVFTASAQQTTFTKDEITDLYNELFVTSTIDSIIWNGNAAECLCGELDSAIYQMVEDRINFFRITAGLSEITLNAEFNLAAQHAALLVNANDQLTHYPTEDMKCYSDLSASGCLKSLLALTDFKNFQQASFITAFIDDNGESNYYVGHRRWLLYTKQLEFGYGATDKSEAISVADGITYDSVDVPEYIVYPWSGYVPVNLIFPKWSFSIPEDRVVDFSKTIIEMYDSEGNPIEFKKLEELPNYLDHTLVWEVSGLFTAYDMTYGKNNLEENGYLDKKIKVVIREVKIDGEMKQFEYFVEPFKP